MATSDYSLNRSDCAVWTKIVSIQSILGIGTPLLNNDAVTSILGWIGDMTLQNASPLIGGPSNQQLKTWINDFFSSIASFEASFNSQPTKATFVEAYLFYYFFNYGEQWRQKMGYPEDSQLNELSQTISFLSEWTRPKVPQIWADSINKVCEKWQDAVVVDYKQGKDILSEANWNNMQKLKDNVAALWSNQESTLTTLQDDSLDKYNSVFLLFLLCGLSTGNTGQQQRVSQIITCQTESLQLPNDNFIDCLLYYVMCVWADPNDLVFNAEERYSCILFIQMSTVNKFIIDACQKMIERMEDIPYPFVDPYNSAVSFDTRKTNMLGAINKAWNSLKKNT